MHFGRGKGRLRLPLLLCAVLCGWAHVNILSKFAGIVDITNINDASQNTALRAISQSVPSSSHDLSQGLDRMHICIVTAYLKWPQRETFDTAAGIADLVETIAAYGARVDVAYAGRFTSEGDVAYWTRHFAARGVGFSHVPTDSQNIYATMPMRRAYETWTWLRSQGRGANSFYNFIAFHDTLGLGIYAMHAKRSGVWFQNTTMLVQVYAPSLWTNQNADRQRPVHGDDEVLVTYALERLSLEMADAVVTHSCVFELLRQQGHRLLIEKLWALPSVSPLQNVSRPPSRHFVVHGEMSLQKKIAMIVRAIDDLPCAVPSLTFTFAGDTDVTGAVPSRLVKQGVRLEAGGMVSSVNLTKFATSVNATLLHLDMNEACTFSGVGVSSTCSSREMAGRSFDTTFSDWLHEAVCDGLPGFQFEYKSSLVVLAGMFRPLPDLHPNVETMHGANEIRMSVCIAATPGRAGYLDALIDSLANQTLLPPGTEVYVLEIGRPREQDQVKRLIRAHAARFQARGAKLTSYLLGFSATVAVARNELMRRATGTHIVFIDDDDVANPRMLELYVRAARTSTDADVFTGFSEDFESRTNQTHMLSLSVGAAAESLMLLHYAGKSNMMVRKTTLEAVGGCTEDSSDSVATPFVDWDLYNKLIIAGARIVVIPEPLFYYRTRTVNSVYHNAIRNPDMLYYAHYKRAKSVCAMHRVPNPACAGFVYAFQQLARPGSGGGSLL